jgi:hypothetical protein
MKYFHVVKFEQGEVNKIKSFVWAWVYHGR